MRTVKPMTELCGCGVPVEISKWTVRSRYGQKPLCQRCSAGPPESRYTGGNGSNPPTVMTDAQLSDLDKWLDKHDPHRYIRGPADDDELERCAGCGRQRRAEVMTRVGAYRLCETCAAAAAAGVPSPVGASPRSYDFGPVEDRSAARVLWTDEDGTEVRDREPDGRPRDGVSYSTRWWVPGSEARDRDFTRVYDWQPA
jgi:hypothetical protein